jgi:hypothetical protein
MFYSKQKIKNLTVTKFAFWNAGKETINNTDIAKSQPLKIIIDNNHEILDFEKEYENNPANEFSFSLSDDKKILSINFDYIDKNQGFILQINSYGSIIP